MAPQGQSVAAQYAALRGALRDRAEAHYLTHWTQPVRVDACPICDSEQSIFRAMRAYYLPLVRREETAGLTP